MADVAERISAGTTVTAPPRSRSLGSAVRKWVTTTDHKLIGKLYLGTSFAWFLIGGQDRNIPAALQHFMAHRAEARRTVELPTASHAVPVSHPDATARLILEAVSSAARPVDLDADGHGVHGGASINAHAARGRDRHNLTLLDDDVTPSALRLLARWARAKDERALWAEVIQKTAPKRKP